MLLCCDLVEARIPSVPLVYYYFKKNVGNAPLPLSDTETKALNTSLTTILNHMVYLRADFALRAVKFNGRRSSHLSSELTPERFSSLARLENKFLLTYQSSPSVWPEISNLETRKLFTLHNDVARS